MSPASSPAWAAGPPGDRLSDHERDPYRREIGRFEQLGDRFFRNVDPDALSVAVDRDGFRLVDHDRLPDRSGVFDRFAVDVDDLIAVAETHFPGQIVVDVAVFDVLVVEVGLSPRIAHPDVDEYGEQDIHQHAADHDQQSLPGRFRRNSYGWTGCFIWSVSIDSSIIPAIFT